MSTDDQEQAEDTRRNSPQSLLTIFCLLVALLLGSLTYYYSGIQYIALFITGILIGFTLFHARFGFASVYRQLIETGNTQMLRAHMLMLATAATLFAPIFIFELGFFDAHPSPALSPLSTGLFVGSFLFGFGMEMGSGLAPSSLYKAEGGRTAMILTLFGFTSGATAGAAHFGFWNESLPAASEFSLATDTALGYPGAWGVQLAIFITLAIGSYIYKKRTHPPLLPALPSATGWKQIIFGSWPLWAGATVLALLNALVLLIRGEPWVLTSAFSVWGAKIVEFLGMDASGWGYWGAVEDLEALHLPVWMNSTSVLNFGVIIGTFITLTLGGLIRFAKIPLYIGVMALGGGLLMGYGATIAFGANVGAYFSGIASFSLHAWIWTIMAILGVYTAYYLERLFDFTRAGSKGKG
ncbi:YeeE/YedE family protein [Salsuginibacillus kocurii]|uniref:YeeE/YedE family protein n=1 Tax=Salsuginibacillus kocurii TaxID=427078 RepID=UPI00036C15D1|nr:YeeE/YedE family protein [Salsuginibacillus kocurii]